MRVPPILLTLACAGMAATDLEAGWRDRRSAGSAATAPQLVASNGVVVPTWASRRIGYSPVPLAGYTWGRRPWAYPLAQQATPSANMARASQLGIGAGPVPGYTNGPPLGNYPTAPVGPTGELPPRRPLGGPIYGYPFNVYAGGAN